MVVLYEETVQFRTVSSFICLRYVGNFGNSLLHVLVLFNLFYVLTCCFVSYCIVSRVWYCIYRCLLVWITGLFFSDYGN